MTSQQPTILFVNHYVALGVSRVATPVEIEQAWKRALHIYNHVDGDGKSLCLAQAAYLCLRNPAERKQFEEQYQQIADKQQKQARRRSEDKHTIRKQKEILQSQENAAAATKSLLDQREKEHRRLSLQQEEKIRSKDAENQLQEEINSILCKSLGNLRVSKPKCTCVCRFCGKKTSRRQSLQQHLCGMSTDMLCVERKVMYLLQAPEQMSHDDNELLVGICTKIARASDEKIRQWQTKIPGLTTFRVKFVKEIGLAKSLVKQELDTSSKQLVKEVALEAA